MRVRRELSFSSLAYKLGAVSLQTLRCAYTTSEAEGVSLETVLVREGVAPELVAFVRDVQTLANSSCERCGRRADSRRLSRLDFVCQCSHPVTRRALARHLVAA